MVSESPAAIIFDISGSNSANVTSGSQLETIDERSSLAKDDIVSVQNFRQDVAATEYSVTIDLDNTSGFYKHVSGSVGIEIYSASGNLVKSSTGASWTAIAGVILDIDGTSAKIAWMEFLLLIAEDTSTNIGKNRGSSFPIPVDLTVVSNDLAKIASGFIEIVTDVNTGLTLPDVAGNLITPAIGDIVARIEKKSGSGTVNLSAGIFYKGVTS